MNAIYKKNNFDKNSTNPNVTFSSIFNNLKKAAPGLFWILISFSFITLAVIYSYSTNEGPSTHNHLVESTAIIATTGLFISIFFLYLPIQKIDLYETSQSTALSTIGTESGRDIWARFWGVSLALTLFNLLNFAFAGWEVAEVQAISFWSGYLLLTMLLFDMRRWRFYRSGTALGGGGRQNDALFAEMVSAFGLASSLIALAATAFVTTLID